MELTVLERLTVLRLLPRRGDLLTLRIVRDLERELSFSEEEHTALEFQQEDGEIRWKRDTVQEKDVEFGSVAIGLVVDALGDAEKQGEQFGIEILGLCDKFGYKGPENDAAE